MGAKGVMHDLLEKLEQAMQSSTGFEPVGSVQSETRDFLRSTADFLHELEAEYHKMATRLEELEKDAPQRRIADALERIEKSLVRLEAK